MDAEIAEIKSKFYNALSNGRTIAAAYDHAIESCLDDEVFLAMTIPILQLVETSTMKATEWLKRFSDHDFSQFIPMVAKKQADEALNDSEKALKQMQLAFTAAPVRKREKEEEIKAKEQARKKTKEGEASNKPGGSNA